MNKKAMFLAVFVGLIMGIGTAYAKDTDFYSDGFSLPVLDGVWQSVSDVGDAQFSLSAKPGNLSIIAEGDVFARTILSFGGDFTVETQLGVKPSDDLQGAGLILWVKPGLNLILIRGMKDGKNVIDFAGVSENELTEHFAVDYSKSYVYLRIVRQGDSFTAWYSEDGAEWIRIGTIQTALTPNLKAGVFAMNGSSGSIQADFNYFRIHTSEGKQGKKGKFLN
ncbi:MAG: hypothetical protein A2Y33_11355 [Spirochaetes bacterium GWF1_51_8]|nr:MAG: hypothetical protein A2Y33_11355 [Spirochaetes bacterium GWF1_51_8]